MNTQKLILHVQNIKIHRGSCRNVATMVTQPEVVAKYRDRGKMDTKCRKDVTVAICRLGR